MLLDVIALTDYIYAIPWTFDVRDRHTAEAVELSASSPDPIRRWTALVNRRAVALEQGDRAAARRFVAEAAPIASTIDLPFYRWAMSYLRSLEALLDGNLDRAEVLASEAYEVGAASGQLDAFTIYGGQLLGARYHEGRMGELIEVLEAAIAETPAVGAYHAGLPAALAQAGDHDDARAALDRFLDGVETLNPDLTWLAAMTMAADTTLMVGDRRAADVLHRLLSPYSRRVSTIGHILCFGPVAHRLGCLDALLGRTDEALAQLGAAAQLATRLDSPIHRAAVALDLAVVVERRDPTHATLLRNEADTLLEETTVSGLPGATGRWTP